MDGEEDIMKDGSGGISGREGPQGPGGWIEDAVHTLGLILELEVFCTDGFLWTQSQLQSLSLARPPEPFHPSQTSHQISRLLSTT